MKLIRTLVLLTALATGLLLPAVTASADPGLGDGGVPAPLTPDDPGWLL